MIRLSLVTFHHEHKMGSVCVPVSPSKPRSQNNAFYALLEHNCVKIYNALSSFKVLVCALLDGTPGNVSTWLKM